MNPASLDATVPRPLMILGRSPNAPDLALRRVLHAKQPRQGLAIVDYQGVLAPLLTKRNRGNLHKAPLAWCDLANRRRPTALFRLGASSWIAPTLRTLLARFAQVLAPTISGATLDAVAEFATRLTQQGTIGLAALCRALKRPELSQSMRRERANASELDQLVSMLDWTLRFPSVWALSEGNNTLDIRRTLQNGGTVWFEVPTMHFERIEHQLVSWMLDSALADALRAIAAAPKATVQPPAPIVLYGLPNACPLPMAADAAAPAKHVGLFNFSATQPLREAAKAWLDARADCWITGEIGDIPAHVANAWLSDAERTRLSSLAAGEVWARSGASGKAVTALAREPEDAATLARGYRYQAQRRLRSSPVKQFSSAVAAQDAHAPRHADLFAAVSSRAALYPGWLRVKSHNKYSHGHDQVTIEQFGQTLDAELDRLASELTNGRYRCRPLRTVRIPKSDGEYRTLRIACVRDRVVQAACLHLLEPLFDPRFSRASFAYRPGRGAHHAVAMARAAVRAGKHHAVVADIRKCFDNVDHDILLRLVGDVVGDVDILRLLRQWLTADVIDFGDVTPSERGVAQGEAISPLLANIYLDPMDKEFERAGFAFVRYADDYLVLCATQAEAEAALALMREFLQGVLRLALKPAKTQIAPVGAGVAFLGFLIGTDEVRVAPEKLAQALDAVRQQLAIIGSPQSDTDLQWRAMQAMNAQVRGFRNYFLIDDAPAIRAQLAELDAQLSAAAVTAIAAEAVVAPLWASRERFCPVASGVTEQVEELVRPIAGAYIETAPTDPPAPLSPGVRTDPEATAASVARQPEVTAEPARSTEDTDLMLVDGRLHVMSPGCFVGASSDDVVVRRRKTEALRAPIAELSMVYLEGKGIGLSAELTMRLSERDIPVVFTPLIGRPAAIAQSIQSLRSGLRQQQVLRRDDPEALKAGLAMLSAKVANQASVLKYFARYRRRLADATSDLLVRCADELRVIADTIAKLDPAAAGARATAMGHEGLAAGKYWSAIASLIPERFGYSGRVTRHATDPFNSTINYVYTMIYGEVWRAVVRAGLDPYFGLIHGSERDQGSLVFDLIEEYRAPFGDRLVLAMIGRGFDLTLDQDGLIRTSCRRKLVAAFHKQWAREVRYRGRMLRPAALLDFQAASIKKMFLGKGDYQPFRFRW